MFDFAQWQSIWIRAVALSWQDEGFRKALLADARSAIKAYLHEDLAGDFPIEAVEIPADGGQYVVNVTLGVPKPPEKTNEEADKLAEYATSIMTDPAFICIC